VELKPKIDRITERLNARKPGDIARAAAILRAGGTVAFPTETVYGLGANALAAPAVARIFAAKQRPAWDPLIVHIADPAMLSTICTIPQDNVARNVIDLLMQAFWPGPLTLLLPRTDAIPDAVTAGRRLVGVRIPSHPVALQLIRQAGVPIAAPSANLFSHTSPTTADHVLADLDGRIDAVLDGGPTQVGLESTVAGLYSDPDPFLDHGIVIYRPGAITQAMIESVVGTGAVHLYQPAPTTAEPESLPSPGVGLRHYAPRARLVLVDSKAGLLEAVAAASANPHIGVLLPDGWDSGTAQHIFRWGPWRNHQTLAQRLFAGLRALDDAGAEIILCPLPEAGGLADAIRDRLQKAAR
jgi:L-threonylcarbamoyladenylate synthase